MESKKGKKGYTQVYTGNGKGKTTAAIGLAILVCFFRVRGTIAVEDVNMMKG